MAYKLLKTVFYNNRNRFEEEYELRFNQAGAFHTGLSIYPFDRGKRVTNEKYELFYIPLLEHEVYKENILKNSKVIRAYMRELPELVNEKIFLSQIIEEIQSTNDIEGVQSTRQEIGEAVQRFDSKGSIRFKGIVNMYLKFGNEDYESIKDITRIREIYDELFLDDIPEKELPDGKLFRTKVVYVGSEARTVHQGNPTEESIIKDLDLLVTFMNKKDIPEILKCIITHYFFEYIHPFYDGNGRMGRFLMSNYLTRKLDHLTGITISNAVLHNKKKYEDAFAEVSNPRNRADLTQFVQSMYEIILYGQEELIKDLEEAKAKMDNARTYLDSHKLTKDELEAMFILCQNHMFDVINEKVKDKDVREMHNWSHPRTKKTFDSLEEKGLVIKISRNPLIHKLTDKVTEVIE